LYGSGATTQGLYLFLRRELPIMTTVRYATDQCIDVAQFRDLLVRSTLGERRPIDDAECLSSMLEHTDILVTAWDGELLIGLSRSLTDWSYSCYLADLAVDERYQRDGIGRRLIDLTQQQLGPRCKIILLAAPAANDYYPRIGFEHTPRAWLLDRDQRVVKDE
jgi:ribosomal protein S18 acetylase RimI-like enzyme